MNNNFPMQFPNTYYHLPAQQWHPASYLAYPQQEPIAGSIPSCPPADREVHPLTEDNKEKQNPKENQNRPKKNV